jgi:sugar/nucleoside kinase (ribokinase family)
LFDFLAIGTITKDLLADGNVTLGGTVTYASVTAHMLGLRTGIIARADASLDLSPLLARGIEILRLPAAATTTFSNVYEGAHRKQYISAVAGPISAEEIPSSWRETRIAHLGPLAQDLPAAVATIFGDALVGVTPQGWMRQWGADGLIRHIPWERPEDVLASCQVLVYSQDDVIGHEELIERYSNLIDTMVVTHGADGCTVYCRGQAPRHIAAYPADVVDPTGCGDVFCAAYLIHLAESKDAYGAARFANCVAAFNAEGIGIAGLPTREQVEQRMRRYPNI